MHKIYSFVREWNRMVLNIYISFYKFTIGGGIHVGNYFRWDAPYENVVSLELDILMLHIQLGWMYKEAT